MSVEEREVYLQRKRDEYARHRDTYVEHHRNYYITHREEYLSYSKEYRRNNREKLRIRNAEYYRRNKHKWQIRGPIYRKNNPEKLAIWRRREYIAKKLDPNRLLRVALRSRINKVLRGHRKYERTMRLVGCSSDALRLYLEAKFLPGMSWSNYGVHGWHIDHIRPCASYDLTDPIQQAQCFHYTNLQPLWAKDNLRKGASWNPNDRVKVHAD